MRINDIIVDHDPLDEGFADTVKKVSTGIGNVLGGARGAWDAAKQGFASGRAAVTGTAAPVTNPQLDAIMQSINKLSADGKKQLSARLANPSATTAAPAPVSDATSAAANGQADQQQAQQQMAATKAANAAKSQQDAAIKAAADAAKSKPEFQQTAADKLAIKTAADKGIREADEKKKKKLKKKVVAEFNSRFLGMMI